MIRAQYSVYAADAPRGSTSADVPAIGETLRSISVAAEEASWDKELYARDGKSQCTLATTGSHQCMLIPTTKYG